MYAYTNNGYRAIARPSDATGNERVAETVPDETLQSIRASKAMFDIASRLSATNWAMIEDADITEQERLVIRAYRAELRALPSHPNFPDMLWPTPPAMTGVGSETGEQS